MGSSVFVSVLLTVVLAKNPKCLFVSPPLKVRGLCWETQNSRQTETGGFDFVSRAILRELGQEGGQGMCTRVSLRNGVG